MRDMLADAVGGILNEIIEGLIQPIQKRIDRLETRSAGCEWKGTWYPGMDIEAGGLVTDRGSLWVATQQTNGTRPGDSPAYKLVVKNGNAEHRQRTGTRGINGVDRG